jgi:cell division protein YceG involved in septum cleavage
LKKRILVILGILLLLIGLVFGILWYLVRSYGNTPMSGEGKTVAVLIPKGAGPQTICKLLEEHRVISNQKSFYR